ECFGKRLTVNRQFDLIWAWRGARSRRVARPEDHSGEASGVGVTQIPREAVQAFFGGHASRAAAEASGALFAFSRGPLALSFRRLTRKLLHRFAGRVHDFDCHFTFRLFFRVVPD